MDDFHVEPYETNMKVFCNHYKLKSLIKDPTSFKSIDKPSSIDPLLTSSSKCFKNCLSLQICLSDFHELIITVTKTKHERFPPKVLKYRGYKNINSKVFKNRLELTPKNTTSFEKLQEIFIGFGRLTLVGQLPKKLMSSFYPSVRH